MAMGSLHLFTDGFIEGYLSSTVQYYGIKIFSAEKEIKKSIAQHLHERHISTEIIAPALEESIETVQAWLNTDSAEA